MLTICVARQSQADPLPAGSCGSGTVGQACAYPGQGCAIGTCKLAQGVYTCDVPTQANACPDAPTDPNGVCKKSCLPLASPSTGHLCYFSSGDAGTECDPDANQCTTGVCSSAGVCQNVSTKTCSAADFPSTDSECADYFCDASDGKCKKTPKNTGAACDDGHDCTYNDKCDDGGHCGFHNKGSFNPTYRNLGDPCWSDDDDMNDGQPPEDDTLGHLWCYQGTCSDPSTSNKGKCLNRQPKGSGAACAPYGNTCLAGNCSDGTATALCAGADGVTCRGSGTCPNAPCGGVGCTATTTNTSFPCGCVPAWTP